MTKRMLIDATDPAETRVVVLNRGRVEELDYESTTKFQLKGNIYLAKVTRVEPSLQAAFVDYGGNRHGFLPFAEIHPDYYRIPIADREALLAEEAAIKAAEEAAAEAQERNGLEGDDNAGIEEVEQSDELEEAGQAAVSDSAAPSYSDNGDSPVGRDDDGGPDEGESHSDQGEEPSDDESSDGSAMPLIAEPPEQISSDPVPDEGPGGEDEKPSEVAQGDGPREPSEGAEASPEAVADSSETVSSEPLDEGAEGETNGDEKNNRRRGRDRRHGGRNGRNRSRGHRVESVEEGEEEQSLDTVGGDDMEDAARRRARLLRRYKIQEVIKRGQVMLVQVAKEERGNKGAALTTYLSLAGRYCVLMPNTARGGGISRKIGSSTDRRRLKEVLSDLEIPDGMAVIVRTAGSERSKPEIKRDYEYLVRLWNEIREGTLEAQAPALIYEEGNLIKRAIRDLYTSDTEDILVEGEEAYKAAKAFMKSLMPSHAKKVQLYKDDANPLFAKHLVEQQLSAMFEHTVQLKSGGYIVINSTEALVAIDVNSGRATRERHIEDTALKTNLEAAEEVARQLRLRDLAGLIVIDFIDMEDNRHNREVERRLKESMKSDRARIQLGRISPFGLLELSRQRLRPSLVETATIVCPHCAGTGRIYSPNTIAMQALRSIAEEGFKRPGGDLTLLVPQRVALFLLNNKRDGLQDAETRFGFKILVEIDERLQGIDFKLERPGQVRESVIREAPREGRREEPRRDEARRDDSGREGRREGRRSEDRRSEGRSEGGRRHEGRGDSPRRHERRPDNVRPVEETALPEDQSEGELPENDEELAVTTDQGGDTPDAQPGGDESERNRKRRRRGKRGGRRRGRRGPDGMSDNSSVEGQLADGQESSARADREDDNTSNSPAPESSTHSSATWSEPPREEPAPSPTSGAGGEPAAPTYDVVTNPDPNQPRRRGWWNKLTGQ